MTTRITILAIVGLVGVSTAIANTSPTPETIQCGYVSTVQGASQSIEAVLKSASPLTGNFSLALKSSGKSGSSAINQGGAFALQPGETKTLGKMSVNADAKVDLTFSITTQGVTYDCGTALTLAS